MIVLSCACVINVLCVHYVRKGDEAETPDIVGIQPRVVSRGLICIWTTEKIFF